MNNAVRHGGAAPRRRRDRLRRRRTARLRVSDDGCGFDPTRRDGLQGHYGLISMRERAEQVRGRVVIESAPGHGTQRRSRRPDQSGSRGDMHHGRPTLVSASSASTITGSCSTAWRCSSAVSPTWKWWRSATTGEQAVERLPSISPTSTLMDLQLPGHERARGHPADPAGQIPTPASSCSRCIRATRTSTAALEAGAATYLLKDTLSEDLVRVIREVHTGGVRSRPTSRRALAGAPQAAVPDAARGRSGARSSPRACATRRSPSRSGSARRRPRCT